MMPISEAIARELHALERKAESARREAERAERDYVDGVTPRPPVRVALEGELYICDDCGRRWDGSDERKREAMRLSVQTAMGEVSSVMIKFHVYMEKFLRGGR